MSFAWKVLPAVPIAALLLAGVARAESRVSAVVGAEGGYGSNPFLGTGDSEQTGSVILTASPTLSLTGPTSNLDLTGRLEQAFFTTRYKDVTNWSLSANAGVKLSPLSDLSFLAAYQSSVSSGLNSSIVIPNPDGTLPPPDPSTTEIAGQRSETFSGRAGFNSRISLRDTLSLSANVYKTDYPASLESSNTTYGSAISVSHIFSDAVSAGLGLSYSRSDYEQSLFGSSSSYSPSANASLRLLPRMRLDISLGASFNKIASGPTKAFFSGSANLCNRGEPRQFLPDRVPLGGRRGPVRQLHHQPGRRELQLFAHPAQLVQPRRQLFGNQVDRPDRAQRLQLSQRQCRL